MADQKKRYSALETIALNATGMNTSSAQAAQSAAAMGSQGASNLARMFGPQRQQQRQPVARESDKTMEGLAVAGRMANQALQTYASMKAAQDAKTERHDMRAAAEKKEGARVSRGFARERKADLDKRTSLANQTSMADMDDEYAGRLAEAHEARGTGLSQLSTLYTEAVNATQDEDGGVAMMKRINDIIPAEGFLGGRMKKGVTLEEWTQALSGEIVRFKGMGPELRSDQSKHNRQSRAMLQRTSEEALGRPASSKTGTPESEALDPQGWKIGDFTTDVVEWANEVETMSHQRRNVAMTYNKQQHMNDQEYDNFFNTAAQKINDLTEKDFGETNQALGSQIGYYFTRPDEEGKGSKAVSYDEGVLEGAISKEMQNQGYALFMGAALDKDGKDVSGRYNQLLVNQLTEGNPTGRTAVTALFGGNKNAEVPTNTRRALLISASRFFKAEIAMSDADVAEGWNSIGPQFGSMKEGGQRATLASRKAGIVLAQEKWNHTVTGGDPVLENFAQQLREGGDPWSAIETGNSPIRKIIANKTGVETWNVKPKDVKAYITDGIAELGGEKFQHQYLADLNEVSKAMSDAMEFNSGRDASKPKPVLSDLQRGDAQGTNEDEGLMQMLGLSATEPQKRDAEMMERLQSSVSEEQWEEMGARVSEQVAKMPLSIGGGRGTPRVSREEREKAVEFRKEAARRVEADYLAEGIESGEIAGTPMMYFFIEQYGSPGLVGVDGPLGPPPKPNKPQRKRSK